MSKVITQNDMLKCSVSETVFLKEPAVVKAPVHAILRFSIIRIRMRKTKTSCLAFANPIFAKRASLKIRNVFALQAVYPVCYVSPELSQIGRDVAMADV